MYDRGFDSVSGCSEDALIRRIESLPIETAYGRFELRVYETVGDPLIHIAAVLRGALGRLIRHQRKRQYKQNRCWCGCIRSICWGMCLKRWGLGVRRGIIRGKELQAAR